MDKLRNMRLFCRVVELGSFARTAQDQHVSPTIIGRHIGNLEKSLSVRLINRTTRTMEITDAGKQYYEGCKLLLAQVEALEQAVTEDPLTPPSGTIKVAAPEGLGSPLLLDAVIVFQDLYPNIKVDLLLENTLTNIVRENVDIAIRLATALEDSSLIVRKLHTTSLSLFASPYYLKREGYPQKLSDLKNHNLLHFNTDSYGSSWPYLSDAKLKKFNVDWTLVTNNTQALLGAIARGAGLGLVPIMLARPQVLSGEITAIELEESFPEVGVFMILPFRELVPKRVSLFAEHLMQTFRYL